MKLQIEEFVLTKSKTKLKKPWATTTLKRQIVFGSIAIKSMDLKEGDQYHFAYNNKIIYLIKPVNNTNLLVIKKLGRYSLGFNAHHLLLRLDVPIDARYTIEEFKDDDYAGYKLELYELL